MTLADREVVVAGPRVRIRAFTLDDVDAWQAWPDYDEPLLRGTSPRRIEPERRPQWFKDLVERQRQMPFAIENERGRFIGRLFLRMVRRDEGSAILGIDLDPRVLGRGYGTEALREFLHHFFGPMGFVRMTLSVAAFNERARRSYASLGFRIVGSHWDFHAGPDVSHDSTVRHVSHLFRRRGMELEALFYDMSLERQAWAALDGD